MSLAAQTQCAEVARFAGFERGDKAADCSAARFSWSYTIDCVLMMWKQAGDRELAAGVGNAVFRRDMRTLVSLAVRVDPDNSERVNDMAGQRLAVATDNLTRQHARWLQAKF